MYEQTHLNLPVCAQQQLQGDPFEMFNMFFGGGGGGGGMGGGMGGQRRAQFNMGGGGMGGGFGGMGGGGMGGGGRGGHSGGGGEGLYDDDPHVQTLTTDTFPAGDTAWVWLVEFYAPWCVLSAGVHMCACQRACAGGNGKARTPICVRAFTAITDAVEGRDARGLGANPNAFQLLVQHDQTW